MGKARRYVADVKAEVNRSIELEELQKMKSQFETAARDVETTVNHEIHQAGSAFGQSIQEAQAALEGGYGAASGPANGGWPAPLPQYRHPGKKWRLKRTSVPRWYKQRAGVKGHVQSGAARVARFRPPGLNRP
jgi:sec-independent protein translocase protein TatB